MTACVISMCAVGSVTAYFTHQQVLGGFSLFLCVAIGIRFLVKPNSGEKAEGKGTAKLNKFQIWISLFFGLTIGFGTGFFGSGGGNEAADRLYEADDFVIAIQKQMAWMCW